MVRLPNEENPDDGADEDFCSAHCPQVLFCTGCEGNVDFFHVRAQVVHATKEGKYGGEGGS